MNTVAAVPLPKRRHYVMGRIRAAARRLSRTFRNRVDYWRARAAETPGRVPSPAQSKRILVVETRHLGDVLFATPAIKSLKAGFPDARLVVMVRQGLEPLLSRNPSVDEVVLFEDHNYVGMVRELGRRAFDVAVLLDRDERLAQLVYQAGIPVRIGYDRPAARPFLTTAVPRSERGTSEIHWSHRLAIAAGGRPVDERMELLPPPSECAVRIKLNLPFRNYIVLHPGSDGSASYKRWPVERYAEVVSRLASRGWTIVVTGLASEKHMADFFRPHDRVKLLFGETSLDDLIDLVSGCGLLITNDTGPSHIAAALNRPCLSVTGFADQKIYHPYPHPHRALFHPIPCSPCFGSAFDPRDCPYVSCLKTVNVDEVFSNASELMETSQSAS